MQILIADDQQLARIVLASHLKDWGHTVYEAENGAAALRILQEYAEEIELIITDWSMPIMDGVSLARHIRADKNFQHYIYIILLTGRGESTDIVHGFRTGEVDDYITKPYDINQLQMRLRVGQRILEAERALRERNVWLQQVVLEQTQALRNTQGEIISRLFNALESRDQETADHVTRIGLISAFLGERLGWPPERVAAVRAAAPLHDVGKIGIPDTILRKPGPLTPEEFRTMQQHTVIGARILSNSEDDVIRMAETIALSHHEDWNGDGYPNGLKGANIPAEARVVAIADVYDALLSDRVYRKGLPEEDVMRIMRQGRGVKFEEQLFDLFANNLAIIRELGHNSSQNGDGMVKTLSLPIWPG